MNEQEIKVLLRTNLATDSVQLKLKAADYIEMLETELREGYRQAKSLAEFLYKRYCANDAPDWEVFEYPNVSGVITQIDNMIAGTCIEYERKVGNLQSELRAKDEKIEELESEQKQIYLCVAGFCMHSYADLDGNMTFPNNKEGDFIKALFNVAKNGNLK